MTERCSRDASLSKSGSFKCQHFSSSLCSLQPYQRVVNTRPDLEKLFTHTGRTSPVLAASISILAFRFLGNRLTAADVFATVTLFQSMRLPFIMAPLTFGALSNIAVSLRRLQAFLLREGTRNYDPVSAKLAPVDVSNNPRGALHNASGFSVGDATIVSNVASGARGQTDPGVAPRPNTDDAVVTFAKASFGWVDAPVATTLRSGDTDATSSQASGATVPRRRRASIADPFGAQIRGVNLTIRPGELMY